MDNFDIVVIGGGIHGAGSAQAAAAAGYSVLLLEKNRLAYGSSSRSSKMIHGGLRYLESAQFHLVHECLQERHLLSRLAPELVYLDRFYIPVYESSCRSRLKLITGLSLYAVLGGLNSSTHFHQLSRNQWPALDGLKQHGLKAVYQYYDGRTDDSRLTRAVMNSAIELGGEAIVPAEFVSAACDQDSVDITYIESGDTKYCRAGAVINATGAWVNRVLEKITPARPEINIDLVQGTHLVLDNLPLEHCFYFEAPQDRRAIFLLPWNNKALLGTTETAFTGQPDNVVPLQSEKDYLLEIVRHYFPDYSSNNKTLNVVDEFAGLRVLPAGNESNFKKSRETVLYRSHDRVVNIYGGKLTTYRLTAERVIKKLHSVLPARKEKALPRNITLKAP
ncbi:MAG: FAD-dependent oxidoreductase [Gammaproteobacteria bacterium]|nr:FAD-dependent oxidoreductase [Gammaproteobacteria bacterium]